MTTWADGTTTPRTPSALEASLRAYTLAALLSGFVFVRITDAPYNAIGDNSTDNTTAINSCLSAVNSAGGGMVWVPTGTFLANDLVTYSNISVEGGGWGSILRQKSGVADNTYLLSAFGSGTTVASNQVKISVRNLQLQGRCDTDTFTQYVHLLEVSGCSDVTVENVFFNKWRGDAICIASNSNGGTQVERHNERLRIRNCKFDGVNFNNRNAITVVDATDLLIEGSYFTNCTASTMPGAIDIEPNAVTYTKLRDIIIRGNTFDTVAGAAGVIGYFHQTAQASLTTPVRNITVDNNTIRNCTNTEGALFFRQTQTVTDSTVRHQILVINNTIKDNAGVPLEATGIRGLRLHHNYFEGSQQAFALGYFDAVFDLVMSDNDFDKIGLSSGNAIEVYSCTRLTIEKNTFDAIGDQAGTGRIVSFSAGNGGSSTSSKVRFINNRQVGFASTASAKAAGHTLSVDTNEWYGNDTTVVPSLAHWATNTPTHPDAGPVVALTYASTMTPDAALGDYVTITPTNTTAMTIAAPTSPSAGLCLTFDFLNSSGGTMGVVTWNAAFKLAGTFTNPANTKRRTITFRYDGTNWVEQNRAAADI